MENRCALYHFCSNKKKNLPNRRKRFCHSVFLDVSILRYITKVLLLFQKNQNGGSSWCQAALHICIPTATSSRFSSVFGVFPVVVVFNPLTWQILTWPWWALISSCALRCVKKGFCLTDTSVCPFRSAVDTRYANVPSPIIHCDHAQVNIHPFCCKGGSRVGPVSLVSPMSLQPMFRSLFSY